MRTYTVVIRALASAISVGFAGACSGEIHAGVPLVDAGDEFAELDPATASTDDLTADDDLDGGSGSSPKGPEAVADASTSAPSKPGTQPAEASVPRAEDASTAEPARDASAPSGRDASARPPRDAGTSPADPPVSARDYSADRSKFLGASRCERAGALVCDDFESESPGEAPDPQLWMAPFGNVPKIDATRAARGKQSLYFEVAPGIPGHIEERRTFPAPNNTVYGRMFVWIDELPTAPAFAYWTLVSGVGSDQPAEVRLAGQLDPGRDNANWFGIGSDHGETGDWATAGQEAQSKARAKDWICLEWLFKGDSSETRVWIDGVEQTSLHLTSSNYRVGDQEGGKKFVHPRFDRLRIGWWLYQADAVPSPARMWIDEVVVDDERVGCVL